MPLRNLEPRNSAGVISVPIHISLESGLKSPLSQNSIDAITRGVNADNSTM